MSHVKLSIQWRTDNPRMPYAMYMGAANGPQDAYRLLDSDTEVAERCRSPYVTVHLSFANSLTARY